MNMIDMSQLKYKAVHGIIDGMEKVYRSQIQTKLIITLIDTFPTGIKNVLL